MHKNLAKTLLATVALAAGLSQTAHAGGYADALIVAAPGHNGQRDPFTDGARISSRDGFTDGARSDARGSGEGLS